MRTDLHILKFQFLSFLPTPLLRSLHWLRVPERIVFRLAVLVYCCLHGTAPVYLSADLLRVSDVSSRQRLRSATTSALVGCRTQRSTIGDRAFAAAAPAVWNSLPEDVRASTSLQLFRCQLKSELFRHSLGPRHST